jgi:hypothetical protein
MSNLLASLISVEREAPIDTVKRKSGLFTWVCTILPRKDNADTSIGIIKGIIKNLYPWVQIFHKPRYVQILIDKYKFSYPRAQFHT